MDPVTGLRRDERSFWIPQDKLILVAQVAGGFGVKGEVRVTAYTADPMALLSYGPLLRADGSVGLTLISARPWGYVPGSGPRSN